MVIIGKIGLLTLVGLCMREEKEAKGAALMHEDYFWAKRNMLLHMRGVSTVGCLNRWSP